MALTRGKKETSVTPSSIASRMGVVPTYGGDWLATAAESIGKNLDVQTKRIATMEEEKWKAQFSIDTYKAINDFAMQNRMNPNGFTKSVDPYVSELVNQVPNKYKGWAKQYAGMMAAREGQQIINRHYNAQQAELIKLNEDGNQIWLDNNLRNLEQTPYAEWDNQIFSSVLAEFSEKAVSYENMYNSLDPQFRSGLDSPEIWKRKHQIAFEGARLNSKNRALLEAAQILDQEIIQSGGNVKGVKDGKTNVDIAMGQIKKNMEEYLKNPDVDNLDGFSTLVNSTTEERQQLKENSLAYANDFFTQVERQQSILKNAIESEYQLNVNSLKSSASKPYTAYDDNKLNQLLNNINASPEDRLEIIKENKKSNIIGALSKLLYDPGEDRNNKKILYNNIEYGLGVYNRTFQGTIGRIRELLLSEGVPENELTDEIIKNQIIESHIYEMTYDPLTGEGRTSDTLSLEYDFRILNNQLQGNGSSHFEKLKQYTINMGIMPSVLSKYITENLNNPLNLEIEGNRDTLVEIAGMVNSLQNISSFKSLAIPGLDSADEMLLTEFYKDYKSYREQTKQNIIEQDFIKNWFELRNNIKTNQADLMYEEFNKKISQIDKEYVEEEIKTQLKKAWVNIYGAETLIGPPSLFGDPATVPAKPTKPLIDIPILEYFRVRDFEAEELQLGLGMEKFMERLPDYMINYYRTRRDPVNADSIKSRPIWRIQEDITSIIRFAINDFNNEGWGIQ